MPYEVKPGQASLWNGEGGNKPVLRGSFIAHRDIKKGEEIDQAYWRNESDNDNAPVFTGKVSDKWVKPTAGGFTPRAPNADTGQGGGHQSRADYASSQEADVDDELIPF